MNKQKGFFGIVLVIIVALFAGGFYLQESGKVNFVSLVKKDELVNSLERSNQVQKVDENFDITSQTKTTTSIDNRYTPGTVITVTESTETQTITGSGYSFQAPTNLGKGNSTVNNCTYTSVSGLGTQIVVTTKNCLSEAEKYQTYDQKTEKEGFVILVSYGKQLGTTEQQIKEIQSAYVTVVATFTVE